LALYLCGKWGIMEMSDKELLGLIINKDQEAYKKFYTRYRRVFYDLSLSYTRDKNVSDEISQIFWIAIWNNPTVIKTNINDIAKGFLYKHFTFCVFDYLKSKAARFTGVPDEFWKSKTDDLTYTHIIEELETNDITQIINKTIEDLPELTQEIFKYRWEQGLSTSETAKLLSVSEQTVRAKYNSALDSVREQIRPLYTSKAYSAIVVAMYVSMFR